MSHNNGTPLVTKDPKRCFTVSQRRCLLNLFDGRCAICNQTLDDYWEADHIIPHSEGGVTQLSNGQPLCKECHKNKTYNKHLMTTLTPLTHTCPTNQADQFPLRKWQVEAMQVFVDKYNSNHPDKDSFIRHKTFVLEATMATGKTIFQSALTKMLMDAGVIDHVIVVAPYYNLKEGAAECLQKHFGIPIWFEASEPGAYVLDRYKGQAVTYQGLREDIDIEKLLYKWGRDGKRFMLIADEVHHTSVDENSTWGGHMTRLVAESTMSVFMSGTYYRTDGYRIPGAKYRVTDEDGRKGQVIPDFSYVYKEALKDGVVSPVIFQTRSGQITLTDRDTDEDFEYFINRSQIDEKGESAVNAQAYKKLLSPDTEWTEKLFMEAHAELQLKREEHYQRFGTDGAPPPAGLCVCYDQTHAKAVAKMIARLTGKQPPVVVSKESTARDDLRNFRYSAEQWIVAVKMISEGTDIERIKVICHLTTEKTELGFSQIVGRALRTRTTPDGKRIGEEAFVLVPEDPELFAYVRDFIEATGVEADLEAITTGGGGGGGGGTWTPKPDRWVKSTELDGIRTILNGKECPNKNIYAITRQYFDDATDEVINRYLFEVLQSNEIPNVS